MSDFKLISLIGCIYKVMSKVLTNRLKRVIRSIISDTNVHIKHTNFRWDPDCEWNYGWGKEKEQKSCDVESWFREDVWLSRLEFSWFCNV